MASLIEKTIGEIVADDFRTAAVFTKYNMDFCCGGHKTVREVCESKNIDTIQLLIQLGEAIQKAPDSEINFKAWPLDLLGDYIIKTHHRYVTSTVPVLEQYLDKLCQVHGSNHPELFEIRDQFKACAEALSSHMQREELILFPFTSELANARLQAKPLPASRFGSVSNPINMMEHEHEAEGERVRKIALLTNNYTPPADACGTYRAAFALLQEFEQDLHKHIHLENNILFPRAQALEAELYENAR